MMDAKLVLALMAAVAIVVYYITMFIKLPSKTKIENLKEWLKYATIEAEKELGGGTGQLKLRLVYDMAITKYNWVAQVVSFETFSKWVDESLKWTREQITNNKVIENYIKE